MTSGQFRVYFVLLLLVVASWLLADLFEQEEVTVVEVVEHSPDYFSTGYYKKEMNAEGLIKNELSAVKMLHYGDDGTTHLEQPEMTLYNSDAPPWVIKSETGVLQPDGDHLKLTGQVLINRDGAKRLRPFMIKTSDLDVQLSVSKAKTKKWAVIIDTPNRTQGIGMEVTFVQPIKLKFLSRVKGRYVLN